MTGTPNDGPDPAELTIEPSVRAIGLLETDRTPGEHTVLEPFGGLLRDGAATGVAAREDRGAHPEPPGDGLPELSYLTLGPRVVRTLREQRHAASETSDPPTTETRGGGPTPLGDRRAA